MTRAQVDDDSINFRGLDVEEAYRSKSGTSTFNLAGKSAMSKSMSSPSLAQKKAPPRVSEPLKPITRLEDYKYSYFVPKAFQREHQEKLMSKSLSKLTKDNKVNMPFAGEGTGFRTCCTNIGWWPTDGTAPVTSYRTQYAKPSFYRMSPMGMSYSGSD
jgi:hypothetical protein